MGVISGLLGGSGGAQGGYGQTVIGRLSGSKIAPRARAFAQTSAERANYFGDPKNLAPGGGAVIPPPVSFLARQDTLASNFLTSDLKRAKQNQTLLGQVGFGNNNIGNFQRSVFALTGGQTRPQY